MRRQSPLNPLNQDSVTTFFLLDWLITVTIVDDRTRPTSCEFMYGTSHAGSAAVPSLDQTGSSSATRRDETAYPAGWLFDRFAQHIGAAQNLIGNDQQITPRPFHERSAAKSRTRSCIIMTVASPGFSCSAKATAGDHADHDQD